MQFFWDVEKPDGAAFGGNCRGFLRQMSRSFRKLGPVSYTHLDVYKRQEDIVSSKVRGDYGITYDRDVLRLIDAFQERGLFVGSVCVTMYTAAPEVEAFEKDVYKRQGYGSAAKYIGVVMKEIIRDATVYGTNYVTVVEICLLYTSLRSLSVFDSRHCVPAVSGACSGSFHRSGRVRLGAAAQWC